MKILILKPSSLGDVVQALPVLRLLKAHDRNNQIYWWISTDLAELLQDDPDLTGTFPFDRHRWAAPRHWGEVLATVRQMRNHRFDWVIDLQALARSSLVAWFAQAKLTVGLEDWREGAPALYDIAVPRPSRLSHAVDWYLQVLLALGVPIHWRFEWLPKSQAAANAVIRKWKPQGKRWIAVHPGARWVNKRWPLEYYEDAVKHVLADYPDLHVAVLGGRSDLPLGAALARISPSHCLDLTGQTSLLEMVEWLRLSQLVVTNDSGPMHIAAALGRPVVSMFGPTEPRRTGPYRQIENALRISLPCAPCLKPRCRNVRPLECLRGINPAVVHAKIVELLAVE